jgi:lysyl-tRNA synthetase class 2
MTWQPNSSVDSAIVRAQLLNSVRRFFAARNVLEVSTPTMSAHTATDPNIESIVAHWSGHKLYLQPSPEHYMKRLLAADYPDIFQVCTAYRDGESGRHHLPEFTMLEWYRHDFGLQAIMAETVTLVTDLLANKSIDQPPLFISYSDAFQNALSLDPLTADVDSLANAVDADLPLRESLGDDRDAWLDLLMASQVASTFAADRLTVVYHYPGSQAALAQLCPDNNQFADRFELYCGPIELANGFVELTDADEQQARFQNDQEKRAASGRKRLEIDVSLIDALKAGLPPTAGVALGIDRLLMIAQGRDDLHSIVTFTPGS